MNTITRARIIVDEGGLTDACSMGDEVDAAASIDQYCTLVAAEASFIAGRRIDCAPRTTLHDAIEYERRVDGHAVTVGTQYLNSIVNEMGEEQGGDDPELVKIAASAQVALERIFAQGDWYVYREEAAHGA
jgi:hypothetical protein